ncbi:unnamed protein product [Lactuca virosa]|uniref:GHMP kinase C-terminal domain-containing protein n=1 Tax=Lactuca virosa TaxID=75947 RepID=A0AAU9N4K4_9ASTR|nr:unnamed protein product [Lactuca virosa]
MLHHEWNNSQVGAYGCTISGAGPTTVAVIDDEGKRKEIGEKMVEAFMAEGNLKALAMVKQLYRVTELVLDWLVAFQDNYEDKFNES